MCTHGNKQACALQPRRSTVLAPSAGPGVRSEVDGLAAALAHREIATLGPSAHPSLPPSLSLSFSLFVCLSFSPFLPIPSFLPLRAPLKRCTPAKQRQPPSSPLHPALLLSSVYSVYGNIPIYHVARVHESLVGTHAS